MASGGAGDGGTVRVRREVFASALRRLDAQLAQARQNAEAISERSQEYRELRGVLKELPEKVSHEVMVPFGPMASFPGQLVHTNEVLCQLSSEYFALRTTGNALKMVDRRLRRLEDEQRTADRELQELSLRRRLAGGEAESANSDSGPGSSVRVDVNGFLDIREPLEAEPARPRESSRGAEEDAWQFWQNPARDRGSDSTLSRLRELEQMEEGSEGPAEANYEDELSELDRIVESYADAENARDPRDFNGTQGPGTQAPSPADLFRLMESSERRSKPSTGAPGAPGAQGSLEQLGVSETVREHSQVALSLEAGYTPSFQAYRSVIQAFLNEKNMDAAQLWLQWMKGNGTTADESIYLDFIRSAWHSEAGCSGYGSYK
ncbi:Uri1 [Symbiodinium sp. KB8]|nr:Uri1 [Symbiodinium sp. KB8]